MDIWQIRYTFEEKKKMGEKASMWIEDADEWRTEAWGMMQVRQDLRFLFITKRIDRLQQCLPSDWGNGYDNVTICCTMENQDRIDYRLPIYKAAPIKHKIIFVSCFLAGLISGENWESGLNR